MKAEVAVPNMPMVSVDVKQQHSSNRHSVLDIGLVVDKDNESHVPQNTAQFHSAELYSST